MRVPNSVTDTASRFEPQLAGKPGGPTAPLLEVRDLTATYGRDAHATVAVRRVSFTLQRGEVLGLVGESGCGKTTTGLALLRLLRPPGHIAGGQINFLGTDLLGLPDREMERLRGNRLSLIFQNPMTSLNPTYTIGAQIMETIRAHRRVSRAEARNRVADLLGRVGMPAPGERLKAYPHELSGGQRQRAVIALAVALEPDLVIADEPTTALDLTIQAQILWLLRDLKQRIGMSMIYITHDLNIAAGFCDRIAVIYAGEIIEVAPAGDILARPQHPYTQGLVASLPDTSWRERMVQSIPGQPPTLGLQLTHCSFLARCPEAVEGCRLEHPPLRRPDAGHAVRCIRR
jgi:oligopeptide/dipeptide ABC transporter ATP-binding protein